MRPDFVGIGVQKAGTSSVADFLVASGATFPRGTKELHWMGKRRAASFRRSTYKLNFSTGAVRGEFTPNYIEWPNALLDLYAACPQTKLLVFLRNPVDRFISAVNHARGIGKIPASQSGDEILDLAWAAQGVGWVSRAIRRGTYVADLRSVFRLFKRSQVFVGFFEDWVSPQRSDALAKDLTRFIGLPEPDLSGARILATNSKEHHLRKRRLAPTKLSPSSYSFLEEYFSQFRPELEELVGPVPW